MWSVVALQMMYTYTINQKKCWGIQPQGPGLQGSREPGGGTQIWVGQGCAARASKLLPIFKGDFGRKGYPFFKDFSWNIGPFFKNFAIFRGGEKTRKFGLSQKSWPMFKDFLVKTGPIILGFLVKSDPLERHIPVRPIYEYPRAREQSPLVGG